MKTIVQILFCMFLSCSLTSCFDFDEMNEDPNNPTETSPQLLLATACWDLFSEHGNFQTESRMIVQTDGESSGQYYNWTRGGYDEYDKLRQVQKMEEEASRVGSNAYVALAKCMKAYYFYTLTIRFGDIPFSEALLGEQDGNYVPSYDTQEDVFVGILTLLEEASVLLDQSEEIISGDILNDGDLTKWQKFVCSFRLKVLLTLSNKTTVGGISVASEFSKIAAEGPLMDSVEEQIELDFLDQSGSRYLNFNSSSFGSGTYMDSTFVQRLVEREDPRAFVFLTQTPNALKEGKAIDDFSAYEGGNPIVPYSEINDKAVEGDISKPHSRYYNDPTCESMMLLGYAEQQFILAEAMVRGWIQGDATATYVSGVKGSFTFLSSQSSTLAYHSYLTEEACNTYLTHNLVNLDQANTTEKKIEYIVTQKYLQLFFQCNKTTFYEHLRTGYPEFICAEGVTVPTRWMYPQDEYDYNYQALSSSLDTQYSGNDDIREVPWYLQ